MSQLRHDTLAHILSTSLASSEPVYTVY